MNRNNMEAPEVYIAKEKHGVEKDNTIVIKKETFWDKLKKVFKKEKGKNA